MSLMRWEPFQELRRMRDEMDRMFESVMPAPMGMVMSPPIDVFEKDGSIVVKANLPGIDKENIEVTATEDSISLKGEFKKEEKVEERGFFRQERQYGRFFRTIPMPTAINPDQVKAGFKDGVLEITAPRSEAEKAKEKKVPVEA